MVHSETVYCNKCGKKLAHWDMFSNIQFEEEWECLADFWKSVDNVWKSKDGKNFLVSSKPDKKYPIKVKRERKPCSLYYHTKYCKTCARKLKYKCSRPRCKGRLKKVRNENGSSTKYTHGGW